MELHNHLDVFLEVGDRLDWISENDNCLKCDSMGSRIYVVIQYFRFRITFNKWAPPDNNGHIQGEMYKCDEERLKEIYLFWEAACAPYFLTKVTLHITLNSTATSLTLVTICIE